MSHIFIAIGAAIAVIAMAIPIAATFLVSVASRREESKHTLSGRAPGPITWAARRLLAYRTQTGTSSSRIGQQDLRPRPRTRPRPRPRASATPNQASGRNLRPAIEPLTISLASDANQDRREPAGTRAA
jgi:hypothetical protein